MLREKIARKLARIGRAIIIESGREWNVLYEATRKEYLREADQIHKEYMAWFLSKLKPLSDEEIGKVLWEVADRYYDADVSVNVGHTAIVQAQLDAVKKELEGSSK